MKITGSSSYVKFDLENGYAIKAAGEMLTGRRFLVYKDTMRFWEEPHSHEEISEEQKAAIIREAINCMDENTVQLIFE